MRRIFAVIALWASALCGLGWGAQSSSPASWIVIMNGKKQVSAWRIPACDESKPSPMEFRAGGGRGRRIELSPVDCRRISLAAAKLSLSHPRKGSAPAQCADVLEVGSGLGESAWCGPEVPRDGRLRTLLSELAARTRQ